MSLRAADVRAMAAGLEQLTIWLRQNTTSEVSSSTLTALDRLRREGPLRVSELAVREVMTQPGVTILVNRLAEAGWAERMPDPTDRRATLVRVTDAGIDVLGRREATRAELLRERLAELDPDDRRLLTDALPAIERLVATTNDTARKN